MRIAIPLAVAALLLGVGIQGASAEETCPTGMGSMMSKDAMAKSLKDRGYTQIRSLGTHNGCYEAKGLDKSGKRFELELNGHTGEVVNAE